VTSPTWSFARSAGDGLATARRISDRQAMAELARGVDDIATFIRRSALDLEQQDPVARHATDEILEALEKYGWMRRAQIR